MENFEPANANLLEDFSSFTAIRDRRDQFSYFAKPVKQGKTKGRPIYNKAGVLVGSSAPKECRCPLSVGQNIFAAECCGK